MKISVVTPSFNSEKTIQETIRSVCSQEVDHEHIIIDGESHDSTCKILREYESEITWWVSEKDKGMYDAINKGMKRAQGEILCYLNSDDFFRPDALKKVQETFLKNPEIDFLFGDATILFETPYRERLYRSFCGPRFLMLTGRMPFFQQSCFWRRRVYEKIGEFDSDLKYCGDFDFFLRIFKDPTLMYQRIPEDLSVFRIREGALSTHTEKMKKEAEIVMARNEIFPFKPVVKYGYFLVDWYLRMKNFPYLLR